MRRTPRPPRSASSIACTGVKKNSTANGPQPRQDAILVRAGEPAIADHIRAKDRRKFPGLAHRVSPLDPI